MAKPTKTSRAQLNENSAVHCLKGVGDAVAQRLSRLGIATLQDLLFHLPLRYQDRTRVHPIGHTRHGQEVAIEGEIQHSEISFAKRRMLLTHLKDSSGVITLRFFHFSKAQQMSLSAGICLRCYGEVRFVKNNREMVHPEYRRVDDSTNIPLNEYLTAIYSTTDGLRQLTLRSMMEQLFNEEKQLKIDVKEYLPQSILSQLNFPSLKQAINFVHYPTPDVSLSALEQGVHPSTQRLAFEELLAHHLSLRKLRKKAQQHSAKQMLCAGLLVKQFIEQLEFELTLAQQRVIDEISRDLNQASPMQRLVQGDVGSGKTIVAMAAALHAVEAGYQVAVMAPTEILSGQHLQNFQASLEPLNIRVVALTGSIKGKQRKLINQQISEGQAQIVVGTQALFQDDVQFNQLGLVIIDEQHRFGVHQRLALRNKGSQEINGITQYPHQLIMTATPIPRTLSMLCYADLDGSVIDELPKGRLPVETVVIDCNRRDEVIDRVSVACREGAQAYWVCTLIEESEALQCQAAEDTLSYLQQLLPDLNIGLVHGRMKPAEKEEVMFLFKRGDIHLLVATTVIEVGVDVANASLMVIENAERLGLSQLHQLRGRVGRGNTKSNCVLMYQIPLSKLAKQRLSVMRSSNDGFEIAQRDLELRGPGEVLGTRQAGVMQFKIADLQRDQHMLTDIRKIAEQLFNNYPNLVEPLILRWIGHKTVYGEV